MRISHGVDTTRISQAVEGDETTPYLANEGGALRWISKIQSWLSVLEGHHVVLLLDGIRGRRFEMKFILGWSQ